MRISGNDRREQVLTIASQLFAKQGYRGTTTRQIAEAAGVNEAILFRHFPTKDDLYWAVIDWKIGKRSALQKLEHGLSEEHDADTEIFTQIAADMLERHRADPDFFRLLLFTALERHQLSDRFFRTYVLDFYEALAAFIRKRQSEGRFRQGDALIFARSFLGMIVYHTLIQDVIGARKFQQIDEIQFCKQIAELFIRGMSSSGESEEATKGDKPATKGATNGNQTRLLKKGSRKEKTPQPA